MDNADFATPRGRRARWPARLEKAEDATKKEVELLIARGATALESGDRVNALRFIDRAWRRAPDNFTIGAFLGSLLLACDCTEAALRHFKIVSSRWPLPENVAGLVRTLVRLGRTEAATAQLDAALNRFAVVPGGALEQAARDVVGASPRTLCGWIGFNPTLGLCGEVHGIAADAQLEIYADTAVITSQTLQPSADNKARFHLPVTGALAGVIAARTLQARIGGAALVGSLAYPPSFYFDGRASVAGKRVEGWVSLGWNPEHAPALTARDAFGHERRLDLQRDPVLAYRWRFDFVPVEEAFTGDQLTIAAFLPDGRQAALPDTPLLLRVPPPLTAPPTGRKRRRIRSGTRAMGLVDVVIPVYRGKKETLECVDAVIATTHGEAEIVVIDDCSPEPELSTALEDLAAKNAITLLRNSSNLGFPACCNRGLALHPTRDVILLNADTLPQGDWLARLKAAAYSAADIGTVTPFTNAGSIASYPGGVEQDCGAVDAETMDANAAAINRGVVVELPVGVGFCLYLRRDCVMATGFLDAETFAAGYGEEVDFCLRAAVRGWRHVLAADVFVRHASGVSFGHRRAALLERSQPLIDGRYPAFQVQVDEFRGSRALSVVRRRLDEARLVSAKNHFVLLVSLALPGGVERFVRERCAAVREANQIPLVLKPSFDEDGVVWLDTGDRVANDLRYSVAGELGSLRELLGRLPIDRIELHHFLNLDGELIDSVLDLGAPVDIYIHDYSWICPQITLIDETRRYCGEPDLPRCEECLVKNGSRLGEDLSVAGLRGRSNRWLGRAAQVIVPTHEAADRVRRYFPAARIEMKAWEKDPGSASPRQSFVSPKEPLRVGLIGAIGGQKGYDILAACAADVAARQLPIEFIVLGYTEDDEALMATATAFVSGPYDEAELPELLDREAPDIFLFPSVWPEIWCFALTYALDYGRPILAFDLGAIGTRLRGRPDAYLLPFTADATSINDAILKIGQGTYANSPEPGISMVYGAALSGADHSASPQKSTKQARSASMPALNSISATVQILPLGDGLYSFSVREGTPSRQPTLENILLPAVQVALGPGASSNQIEFLASKQTNGSWLCQPGDIVVARVSGKATIALTSLQSPTGQSLSIDVQKLDTTDITAPAGTNRRAQPAVADSVRRATEPLPTPEAGVQIPVQIRLHLRNVGDAAFLGGEWAGRSGRGRWIEAYTVMPQQELSASDIEYKGLIAGGPETPWLSNGAECGTRGKATPLIGFAIRLRRNGMPPRFDCEYSGYFGSGTIVGPLKNGAPCRSVLKDDPLEGIQLRFSERTDSSLADEDGSPPDAPGIGPRFSKLREENYDGEPRAENADRVLSERSPAHDLALKLEAQTDPPIFELPGPLRFNKKPAEALRRGRKAHRRPNKPPVAGTRPEE